MASCLFYVWIFDLSLGVFFVRHKLKFILCDFIFSEGLEAFIGNGTKISFANLAEFPPFFRFDDVLILYPVGSKKSLSAKCRLFEDCLESIKCSEGL